ncbi:GNAT family N-acetyltransferase [Phenylobacterium montanum]|uniref:GNAT family N-acetyltransferase n=1 Tax=Phenylobacterium montanum TaxID=2823693 RepID=A0A975IUX3_9CAUL|nr:GNAT family N-acetyltransferase [Caulobacter sp. S6]QUD88200.1 GNAT family N-acetyltransferase [Caulobacter sp. S6]
MPDFVIAPATDADLPAVVELVNSAYRGEGAEAGWTTEASYIDGQRTSLALLAEELAATPTPSLLLLRREAGGDILACAMVEPHIDEGYAYLGMITVKPGLQAGGVGRAMLEAAEAHAAALGARRTEMTVVHLRDTLIAWYERRGYRLTGARKPFPYDDARFGTPRVAGLEFVVLDKAL